MFFSHQSLIGFFGPHGPPSLATQGLLMSTTFDEHEFVKRNNAKAATSVVVFFIDLKTLKNRFNCKQATAFWNVIFPNQLTLLFLQNSMFKRTLVIGLGLMGGSFAKAIRRHKLSVEIFACDPDSDALISAEKSGVIDGGKESLELFFDEISDFDFIVIAAPLSTYEELFSELHDAAENALIIDLGSIKNLADQLENLPKRLHRNFVPCHPIAGLENSGFENSSAELFIGKKFVVCAENSAENFVKKTVAIVQKIGAVSDLSLSSKKHDEVYALVSHLPQFLSFLTAEFSPKNTTDEFFKKAFRLDNSSPDIWEGDDGIFALNEENLEKFYQIFFDNLLDFFEKFSVGKFSEILQQLVLAQKIFPKNDARKFDEKFLEENFSAIFFRILIVASYLKIPEIKSYSSYAGSGFKDFTSIIEIVNFDEKNLLELMKKDQQKISKMLNEITA